VARTSRLGVSGCVYRTWQVSGPYRQRSYNVRSPCGCHVNVRRQYLHALLTYGVLTCGYVNRTYVYFGRNIYKDPSMLTRNHNYSCLEMPILQPQILRNLLLHKQISLTRQNHNVVFLVLLREVAGQQARRRRRWWVRTLIERRRLLGQYETLIQELERESRRDYVGYIRIDPNLFAVLLLRVTPQITKKQGICLPVVFSINNYLYFRGIDLIPYIIILIG